MRNAINTGIIILFCISPFIQSFGQKDTLKLSSNDNGYSVNGKYRDRSMAIYLNGKGSIMNADHRMIRYGLGSTFEYKLYNNHSLGAGLSFLVADDWPIFSGYYVTDARLEFEIGYRYYHNLNNRMSKGLTGNNFSANYFLISPYFWLQYRPFWQEDYYWDFNKGIWLIKSTSEITIKPGVRIGYGLQRTFWRNFNFDINGGIQIRKWTGSPRKFEFLYLQFSIGYIIK